MGRGIPGVGLYKNFSKIKNIKNKETKPDAVGMNYMSLKVGVAFSNGVQTGHGRGQGGSKQDRTARVTRGRNDVY